MNKYVDPRFFGTWTDIDEDTRTNIKISCSDSGNVMVKAYDRIDGEEFRVDELRVSQGCIEFEIRVPRTGYRSHNKFTLAEDGRLDVELTLYEKCKRTEDPDNAM